MVFRIFGRWHFFHLYRGVDDTKYQNGCSDIEGIDNRVGNYTLGSYVADAYPCKDEREQETYQATGIAQETLDRVGKAFLLFVYHVAYHHFEWLHRHIDGCIQKHQRY